MRRRLRLGMIGGGQGAFIGAVHRIASRLDDHYELVAGVFSSNFETSKSSAEELRIDPGRHYKSFEEMAKQEAEREDKIDVVAIVTPNHLHHDPAVCFLNKGFNVICDKPLTLNLEEANSLVKVVEKSGSLFALTHNYTGYPMVRQAREMIINNELGPIRLVQAEYAQDWLATNLEANNKSEGYKQASWRTDPKRSGAGGCIGDIGTHAFNLISFITQLELQELSADLTSFVPGRELDDNAQVMLRFKSGAKGSIWSSQVATGNENGLTIRVYGEKGGIFWNQENPNYLKYSPLGKPPSILSRSGPEIYSVSKDVTRIPAGHPEGYLEGFANIYSDVANAIWEKIEKGKTISKSIYPNVYDGLNGIKFIEKTVESSTSNSLWVKF
ncbi:MAG: Gfo/Idh/MocA family oxidoreductase [Alphaproteobacteria bacterium]|nr:Gfo/Idh/MocA family oxidoreductase [Alphaproteobacteria bacterium]